MVLSAGVSTLTPIWVGRFFRMTQPFVLATVALALWKLTCRSRAATIVLFTTAFLGLAVANRAFWQGLDLENGRGVQGAVDYITAHRTPTESIVALDMIQYFPAKFYMSRHGRVRMLEPEASMFWGWHLIRPDDLVTADELDEELDRGVWLISTTPRPAVTPRLIATAPAEVQIFTYYNHLHARVYVHHYPASESGKP
jgi:hypothetical protein